MFAAEVEPRSRMQRPSCASQVRESSPRPLERRVGFCDEAGSEVAGPLDELRNSFMKFLRCRSYGISRPLALPIKLFPAALRLGSGLALGPLNIDFALYASTLFH